jgi:hypothetical protein
VTTEHIFISYAHHDRAFVDTLAARLEAADVAVWYDRDLTPGRPWSAELEARLQEPLSVSSSTVAPQAGKRLCVCRHFCGANP